MLSLLLPHRRRQWCEGAVGSRLRTKRARCISFRQFRSSVASEIGVPSDGQMMLKGACSPRLAQFASQLGGAVVTVWWVNSLVRRLMLRCWSFVK